MSHTGSFIHPTQSPGIIRMITLGFTLTEKQELVFAIPPKTPDIIEKELEEMIKSEVLDSEKKEAIAELEELLKKNTWLRCAEERFVIYPGTKKKYRYGEPVCFNLVKFEAEKWKTILGDKEQEELKNAIPKQWIEKLGNAFEFKYIATEVKKLPNKFVLYPLYRFIRDMDLSTADHVLMKLRDIEKYNIKNGLKVNVGHVKGDNKINSVAIVDYDTFIKKYEKVKSIVKDFLQSEQVDKEIERFGQHFISSDLEIPTWQRE